MLAQVVLAVSVWLFGLAVGSFLNVVLFRLPLGLSVARPARSFCPRCETSLAWFDNVPLLSWLLLRGRCRSCKALISVQYPLVEALTGLAFVLVYYLLFVFGARMGVRPALWPDDAPLLLAWLLLTAAMIACAGMDLVSYMVDTRVTNAAMYGGILLYAVWPRESIVAPLAGGPGGAAAVAAFLATGLLLWWSSRRARAAEVPAEDTTEPAGDAAVPRGKESGSAARFGVVALVALVALTAWLIGASAGTGSTAGPASQATFVPPAPVASLAVPGALLAMFVATVIVGGQSRDVDEELHTAIEQEAPVARRMAFRELAWLSGPMFAALVAYALVVTLPAVTDAWATAVVWPGASPDFAVLGGAAYAIHGAIVGAAAGWMLRIVFTLIFGREAFGIGDIYILAAAGAAGGWDIALLGLLLGVGVAMAGWIIGLLLKSTGMIPFGPWLAIGFVCALWLNRPAADVFGGYWRSVKAIARDNPPAIAMAAGIMLVGTAVAVLIARLVRRWVEPKG